MRTGLRGRLWTLGAIGALGLAASACSTTNSTPSEMPSQQTAKAATPVPMRGPDTSELGTVYFELDSAVLKEEGRTSLQRDAERIQSNPDWGVVTVEGHCDERGSEEYNLALGEKRAHAVASYLSDLGVPEKRLTTRSFGEMQPASAGHDEFAWSANRRAQLEIKD